MNICSPIRKHYAPFSDTVRVYDMFTIDRNKSLVNFTGSDVLLLQKPNHTSHLTVGGSWYQRVHCLNLSHSQRGKVCSTNCTRHLSTLYWTHHMTHQLKLNNCVGCMRKRSLLSRCPMYIYIYIYIYIHIQRNTSYVQLSTRQLFWDHELRNNWFMLSVFERFEDATSWVVCVVTCVKVVSKNFG